jgi:hypothetical protein
MVCAIQGVFTTRSTWTSLNALQYLHCDTFMFISDVDIKFHLLYCVPGFVLAGHSATVSLQCFPSCSFGKRPDGTTAESPSPQ